MAIYTLPDLDYDYSALEPYISAEIMQLHHDKHHKAYVDGANTALDKLAEARDKGEFGAISKLEKDLAFNLGGHTNHSVFWKNLAPNAPERPDGELAAAIDEYFGTFDPIAGRLNTLAFYDQQNNLPVGSVPLLLLDMWEHAFYLQYKNVKADYVTAFWNIVNWSDVAERFAKASAK